MISDNARFAGLWMRRVDLFLGGCVDIAQADRRTSGPYQRAQCAVSSIVITNDPTFELDAGCLVDCDRKRPTQVSETVPEGAD